MPSRDENQSPLLQRLDRLFSGSEPDTDAAKAALDHIQTMQRRINAVREDMQRGIRRKEGRFRL